MARVPRQTGREVRSIPLATPAQTARGATSLAFGGGTGEAQAALAQGLNDVSDEIGTIALKEQIEENERVAKDLENQLAARLREISFGDGTAENPGFYGLKGENAINGNAEVRKAIAEARDELKALAPNERVKSMFSDVANRRIETELTRIASHVSSERNNAQQATAETRMREAADDAAANWSDPKIIDRSLGIVTAEAIASGERNGWSPEVTQSRIEQAQTQVLRSAIETAVAVDPEAAQALVETYEDKLDGTSRASIATAVFNAQDRLINRRIAMEERAYRLAKRNEDARSDGMRKEGQTLAATGQLTTEWVVERRGALNTSDYETLLKAARQDEGGEDDSSVVVELYLAIANGEDVEAAAIQAFAAGVLERTTMNTILARNDKIQGDTGTPSAYKRGTRYLQDALRPSDLNDNPEARLAYARALDDFNVWWEQQETMPTAEQARTAADTLVDDYRLVRANNPLALPFRPWMEGDRTRKTMTAEDVEATKRGILEDLDNGVIDDAEAVRRIKEIEQWENYLQLRSGAN